MFRIFGNRYVGSFLFKQRTINPITNINYIPQRTYVKVYSSSLGGGRPFDEIHLKKFLNKTKEKEVALNNLPNGLGNNDLKKVLMDNGIVYKKLRKEYGTPSANLKFNSREELEKMVVKLAELCINGNYVVVSPISIRKIRFTQPPTDKRIEDVITPLWNIDYQVQLKMKEDAINEILRGISRILVKKWQQPDIKSQTPQWIRELEEQSLQLPENQGKEEDQIIYTQCCALKDSYGSPITVGYRNKIEFTIGHDVNGEIIVGFVMGKFREGITAIGDPQGAVNSPVNPLMLKVKEIVQNYVRNSELPIYDKVTHEGFWSGLAVRTTSHNEISVSFLINKHRDISDIILKEEERKLIELFTSHSKEYSSFSLFWKENHAPNELFYGKKFVTEYLNVPNKMVFEIQPGSFFQTNTQATELLYKLITSLCMEVNDLSIIYDLCCGTGTIGLSVASSLLNKQSKPVSVIGIELIKEAIEDANRNAKLNKIENTKYFAADVRNFFEVAGISRHAHLSDTAVAILDPPRAGVCKHLLQTLRDSNIKRIIYISCEPKILIEASFWLCGTSYKPTSAYFVDMFPHTDKMESIVVYDRIEKN